MRLRALGSAVAVAFAVGAGRIRTPDLTISEAAKLISNAPEFNHYFRLITVEHLYHLRHSWAAVSLGLFTFVDRNSPAEAVPVKAFAEFQCWEQEWHLKQYDYGCDHSALHPGMRAADCHIVNIRNPPPK